MESTSRLLFYIQDGEDDGDEDIDLIRPSTLLMPALFHI
ncbi:unnamed protein product [Musa acuminata subsp. malaccensis]|uniref:(wild Malaysian banana) hypothetical protein n=1 Tax=Musa acuminata subsp. malaccensis TaxID=214687 RepID=A0A804JNR2_MUSAM|nr:unnamed protein product [Musa acuminata subsp. malaccensis]